jgi:SAM-dependent methyltransferase
MIKDIEKSNSKTKAWNGHEGRIFDTVNGFDVIECGACGFKHIVPVPTAEEMEEIYREEYYSKEKPLYLERVEEDRDWWNMVYGERYDCFEEKLPSGSRRILDIGSGPGLFLLHGKQRGWQTLGVEPSSQAAAYSRDLGLEIVESLLDGRTAKKIGAFDVVYMHEVLEHIPDPSGMLRLAGGLLNPGGLLCVVVPNDYNPFQYALVTSCGYEPWWVAPPHHINYFDLDSLSRLLASSGFEVMSSEATFPIDIFLLMGDDYVGKDDVGRRCHERRKRFEHNMAKAGLSGLKRTLYKALGEHGIGREVMVMGYKR